MDVEFTSYALRRMRRRDVLEEEVLRALESPASQHKIRKDGRSEVRLRVRPKLLLVVYRRDPQRLTVINVIWED